MFQVLAPQCLITVGNNHNSSKIGVATISESKNVMHSQWQ
jgi:hypothetical protein